MTTPGKPDVNKPGNDEQKDDASRNRNEGEGSRTAAKAYNDATHRFIDAGKVPDAARDAERALSSSEREAMVAAEAKGKARARH
jgi:hypothetical protein